jgi:Zn-dependent protease with chaperone function
MVTVNGQFFEAHVSARHNATLVFNNGNYSLRCSTVNPRSGAVKELTVSNRIGNIPRRIEWPDGATFESTDNRAIDLAIGSHKSAGGLVHKLESHWRYIPFAIALIGLTVFSLFKWGLPAASYHIANRLPVSAHEMVSEGAMTTLDKILFKPSTVSQQQQTEIRARFNHLAGRIKNTEFNYRLYFREMSYDGFDIPNAMALPGGEIIVTDALVAMAQPLELDAVLLHEIGHVEEHHGMQQAINASATSVAVSLTLGEMSGLSELITAVPVVLLHSGYSRANESAADQFAFARMAEFDIDPKHFATIITKLGGGQETETNSYFASHPGTAQRAEQAMQASATFNTAR